MKKKILSLILCVAMCLSLVLPLTACEDEQGTPDALVIMTEELDGLFNPFYSTTANDATIVAMTQISMITTGYENGNVEPACGDEHAVAVKDYNIVTNDANNTTVYTFVMKNGITFSDGHPLTIEDVLFNMYVYLDPVYTGSSTMYSTDIVGLADYRSQTFGADTDVDDTITEQARDRAKNRVNELINLYKSVGRTNTVGSYEASYDEMVEAISNHSLSSGYINAISNDVTEVTTANLKADYDLTLKYFKEELENDYDSAKGAFTEAPYKSHSEFQNEVFCFMFYEGFVDVEYAKDANNKDIKSQITKLTPQYSADVVKDKESAINYVYNSKVNTDLEIILKYWGTAQKIETEFMAKAKEVILHANAVDGSLAVNNISGIKSLGHHTDVQSITINGNTYPIAHSHNSDGTPTNVNEYDVLQITINGVDPKAIWNFAFSVAPQHYYGEGSSVGVDVTNHSYGVEFGSFNFMTDIIQSVRNIKLPMGAGAYKVTDASNSDTPSGTGFYSNNVVYFKANNGFLLGQPEIEKIRYQVVSASNALNVLESGAVHFVTPQFTQHNIDIINGLSSKGIKSTYTDQLGYGYIGINAGKVPDINIRKAIMSAMNISLALSYYSTGMSENIYWPMSTVSWAYPKDDQGNNSRDNGHDYPALQYNKETAKQSILDYMEAAGVSAGDSSLKIKFTIAGSNLSDHPTYATFQSAADLLNECGWEIEVVADTQALTKLSTGSLAVWAAAWGSTVDPDLYQVYHKNSTATSVLAWGYREILSSPGQYPEENTILTKLSDVIDEAREVTDKATRTALYEEAMGYILDLAVELPVYQRKVLYAYDSNVIDSSSLPAEINPYTSPLDTIWDIKFAE